MNERVYKEHLEALTNIVDVNKKNDWVDFTDDEKLLTENTVLLVGLLFNMCKVKVVLKSQSESEINKINHEKINNSIANSEAFLNDRKLMPKTEI